MTSEQVTTFLASVDFTTITVGIVGVISALAAVYIVQKGGGMLLGMLRGR